MTAEPEAGGHTTPTRPEEQIIYGLRTCAAVFQRRPQDIVRIYYRADRLSALRTTLHWAASNRLAYRELDDEHLQRVTQSIHHEGVAMAVRPLQAQALRPAAVREHALVALDDVGNPHNMGAIIRTCAFFGLDGVLMGGVLPGTRLSGAVMRNAEGGAEMLALYGCETLFPQLAALQRKGIPVIGLETDAPASLGARPLPRSCVILFGNEQTGITPSARRVCSAIYAVRGAGRIGSLNVSVAVGIALAEWARGAAAQAEARAPVTSAPRPAHERRGR